MESRIASSSPPIALWEREVLDKIQIGFLIPPLPSIFPATATKILNKALLKAFINNLLLTLRQDINSTDVPNANHWGLESHEGGFLNLDGWNPRQRDQDVYKVIALPVTSDPNTLTPIHPEWAILGGGLQSSRIKFIPLQKGEVFEIGESHIVLVVQYTLKVRVGVSKKKIRMEEKIKSLVISADMRVVDLVKQFKSIGSLSGILETSSGRNLRTTDARTATDLGWKHGTELRLEIS